MNANAKPAGGDRAYKRRWKNLLINKRYQLRFTLFMVGLATVLMVCLGVWVMMVANETTTVSMASVRGEACPKIPTLGAVPAGEEDAAPAPGMKLDDAAPDGDAPAPAPAPGSAAGSAAPADEPRHVHVQIDESSMTLTTTIPPDYVESIAKHWRCELVQSAKMAHLERGRLHILWLLIGSGLVLAIGLAMYGIKMTHKVAGPLFKVSLYMQKMSDGRFDKVYNLRKGDQLVDFYDHFRTAHAGVVTAERADIAHIAALVAAADAAGEGDAPQVVALRELLARKEKSVE